MGCVKGSGRHAGRALAICLLALLPSGAAAAEADYGALALRYADHMIEHGTDRWGREASPQLASMLLRRDPPELLPDALFRAAGRPAGRMEALNLSNVYKGNNRAHKITYRGGDVAADAALYKLLYSISDHTGDGRYARAADASLAWFLANAPLHNGLLPWGEHSGWDFRRERADYGYAFDKRHEFDSRWPLWDRFAKLQPRVRANERTVLENFARALWRGAVSEAGGQLLYCRHAHLFDFDRPTHSEWTEFGMFPRHGGYYIGLWSAALAATANREFEAWMLPRLQRFVAELERQTAEHGFAVYLQKGRVVYNARQVASLAVDLTSAADRLRASHPALAERMSALAMNLDKHVVQAGEPVHALDALRRAQRNPAAAEWYLAQFRAGAEQYLKPLQPRELGAKVAKITQPGRIPGQSAEAIEVLLAMSTLHGGSKAAEYLEAAKDRAREAIGWFLGGDSPLPRAIDKVPLLPDGTPFEEFYNSYLGGDDLMRSLWQLSRVAADKQTQ